MISKIFFILFLMFISAIFAFPHIVGFFLYKNNYFPLNSTSTSAYAREETYTYAPEVQQILEGHFVGDPYIWEYRNSPSPYLSEISTILPIAFLSLLSGRVSYGFILSSVFFPSLLFLVIYLGLLKLGYSKTFSFLCALGVIFIPFLSTILPRFSSYGTLLTGVSEAPLFFSRIPHPQISTLYLITSLIMTAIVLKRPNYFLITLWTISLVLSFYASPFVSSTTILATVFLVPFLIKRINKKILVVSFSIIAACTVFILIDFIHFQKVLRTSDYINRFSFPIHFLFPNQLRYFVIALVLLATSRKNQLSKVIVAYIFSAFLLVDSHQLILGRNIQGDHWISRILAPVATLTIFLILWEILKGSKRLDKIWLAFAIIITIIGINTQVNWVANNVSKLGYNQNKLILSQIKANTIKTDVIGTLSPQLNEEIRANTGRWNYYASGDRTFIPMTEEIKRICNLAIITRDEQAAKSVLNYALALEIQDQFKVEHYRLLFERCLNSNKYDPKYKLDFIVIQNNLGSWQLIKAP